MKRIIAILLSFALLFAFAQEHQINSIFFPVYVKSSYCRENSDSPLTKWKYNIGMTFIGKILD